MKNKMTLEVMLILAAVAYASLVTARESASYPHAKLASFVVETLDLTSLPSAYRPKKEKGKKTLADYGYATHKLEEKEALVEASDGTLKLSFTILEAGVTGIYACVAEPAQNGGDPKIQSVILLKRKDSTALLKGQESSKNFRLCPVIGGSDNDSTATSY
jgi:hypothetical protein